MNTYYKKNNKIFISLFTSILIFITLLTVSTYANNGSQLIINCIEDSFLRDGDYLRGNYGSANELGVKDGYTADYTRKAVIKFNLTNTPIGKNVKLRLKGSNAQDNASILIDCFAVHNNWSEGSITWSNSEFYQRELVAQTCVNGQFQYYDWDITDYINCLLSNGITEASFLLNGQSDSDRYVSFASKETDDGPVLVVAGDMEIDNIHPVEDTFVQDGSHSSTSFGGEAVGIVKDGTKADYTRETLFKMDIRNISISNFDIVYLNIYGQNISSGTASVICHQVNNGWYEDTVTWDNRPTQEIEYLDKLFVTDERNYRVDITSAIVRGINNGEDFVSIRLAGTDNEDKGVRIHTKEASSNQPFVEYVNHQVVFEDQFNGGSYGDSMDMTKWSHRGLGPRHSAMNIKEAVFLDGNGNLIIDAYTNNGTNYTGMIKTNEQWRYGKYEARIKFQTEAGMWSAFWLQSPTIGNPIGNPEQAGVEIDIVEHLRHYWGVDHAQATHINLHWDGYDAAHKKKGTIFYDVNVSEDFHTFTLEWSLEKYRFLVDGKLAWVTNSPISDVEEYIILSNEIQNIGWAGIPTIEGFTSWAKMVIDYVKVSQEIN